MQSQTRQAYAGFRALTLNGFRAQPCTVEVVIRPGIPDFRITGMSGGTATQCAERVRAAIRSAGLRFPYSRVLVNLAPADLEKRGGYFDLVIAAAILKAMHPDPPGLLGNIHEHETLLLGELTLAGRILAPERLYSFLMHARSAGFKELLLARSVLTAGRVIPGLEYRPLDRLGDLLEAPTASLKEGISATHAPAPDSAALSSVASLEAPPPIRLTEHQRRALLISAAGRHPMLLIGPPGCGKTMLARLVPRLLPPPDEDEALEIIAVHEMLAGSVGIESPAGLRERPFRVPHHTATIRALIGGGPRAEAGEVTRAHRGVLFLDEMAEFSRGALQALREPMEDGVVRLSRAATGAILPANFLFLAATNPCPCGNFGNPRARCDCPEHRRTAYLGRITGPLRDRIALEVPMYPASSPGKARGNAGGNPEPLNEKTWARMNQAIQIAREAQTRRYAGRDYHFNGEAPAEDMNESEAFATIADGVCAGVDWREATAAFSPRMRANIIRVTRTIADLAGAEHPSSAHLREALSYVFPRAV